jgi:hypothetical protein
MMTLLEGLRNALATIPGVQSCKIGLEDNITPDDYPMIRVVPSRLENGQTIKRRKADVLIYFGLPIQSFDDTPDSAGRVRLEKLYAALFALEDEIRRIVYLNRGNYRETIADEDRLDTYKLMAIRCEVEG